MAVTSKKKTKVAFPVASGCSEAEETSQPVIVALDGGWGWVVVVAGFFAQFITAGFQQTISVYVVEWQIYFSASAGTLAVFVSAFSLCNTFAGMLAGALCKRFGCNVVLILSGIIACLSLVSASFITALWQLHIFAVLFGIGFGMAFPPPAIITSFYFKRRLGLANGIVYSGVGFGVLSMAPLLERLISWYGWRGTLFIHSAITANMFVCGALFKPPLLEKHMRAISRRKSVLRTVRTPSRTKYESSTAEKDDIDTYLALDKWTTEKMSPSCWRQFLNALEEYFDISILLDARFCVFLFVVILSYVTICSYIYYIFPMLVFDLGFSKARASFALTILGICNTLARLLHGFLLDNKIISAVHLFTLALVCLTASAVFTPLATSYGTQYALAGIFGAGFGTVFPLIAFIGNQFVGVAKVANAMGILIGIPGIGAFLGLLMIGMLHDIYGSYSVSFYIAGGAEAVALLLMMLLIKLSRHERDENSNKITKPA